MDDFTTTTGSGDGAGVALASRLHLPLGELLNASLDDKLIALEALTASIAVADPVEQSGRYGATFLGRAALRTHPITECLTGARLDWMGLEEEAGTGDTSKGFRTYAACVAKTYGITAANARRIVSLAKGLRNSLPATRRRLRAGQIGIDRAQILLKAVATQAAADALQLPAGPTPDNADSTDATGTGTGTDATGAGTEATCARHRRFGRDRGGRDGRDGRCERWRRHVRGQRCRVLRRLCQVVDHFVAIADPDATDRRVPCCGRS
ncbi:DUF222 domain-containing protein [Occultella glacieicola]|uniref:DUF222 domain-containing protein n=1 Tax=Occultella glacieicola TaxID=2518684 RepID=A0ABY2E1W6_9MICO|nr:DUF222 domain-containing protein [Occultella glacieicola]TDE92610.1 DUF222 domain-containing protein [Occultella glacieicola]